MGDGRMRSWRARVLLAVIAALVLAQFWPMRPDNPASAMIFTPPAAVEPILRRACWDCHSNETRWPWYARVAPMSWLVVDHVREGREKLNFSDYAALGAKKQAQTPRRCWRQVEQGHMPLRSYLWMHAGARLGDADRAALRDWAAGSPPLPQGSGGEGSEPGESDKSRD